MRLIPAAVLLALGLLLRPVFAQALQPIGVCYAVTTGSHIETTYVNLDSSGAYPIFSSGSVEAIDGGFIARHMVRFEYRVQRVYLPGVVAR